MCVGVFVCGCVCVCGCASTCGGVNVTAHLVCTCMHSV